MNDLGHDGILGMHWGIRRTPEQLGRRVEKKICNGLIKTMTEFIKKLNSFVKDEFNQKHKEKVQSGKIGKNYIKVIDLAAPSGRVIQFVSERGDISVHMASADRDYDMDKLKNGVYNSSRVAYKKNSVDMA